MSSRPHFAYSKSLDGLRGIAVLAVVGSHYHWPWLKGGIFGVDIFFALSGFLITTLLLDEYLRSGAISLGGFFRRRCLRLYPALVAMLVASTAAFFIFHPEVGLKRVGLLLTSVLLYFSNWAMIADRNAWLAGTGHTWSLAVEAQFYGLWAVTVFFVTRRWGANLKALLAIAATAAVASAAWRIFGWLGGEDTFRPYFGTDTRLDALFMGAVAALWRLQHLAGAGTRPATRGEPWLVRGLEIALVLTMGWLLCTSSLEQIDRASLHYLGGSAVMGAAAALLILTTLMSPFSVFAGPLQTGVLAWFGRISYSLYLWHLPVGKLVTVERMARLKLPLWCAEGARSLLSVGMAALSYYCVERIFLRLKDKR